MYWPWVMLISIMITPCAAAVGLFDVKKLTRDKQNIADLGACQR